MKSWLKRPTTGPRKREIVGRIFPVLRKTSRHRAVILVIILVILAILTAVFLAYGLNQAFGVAVLWAILWGIVVGIVTLLVNSFCVARMVRKKKLLRTLRDVYPGIVIAVITGVLISFAATTLFFRDRALVEWKNSPAVKEISDRHETDIQHQKRIIDELEDKAQGRAKTNVAEDVSLTPLRAVYREIEDEYKRADAEYQWARRDITGSSWDLVVSKRSGLQSSLDSAKHKLDDAERMIKDQINKDVAALTEKANNQRRKVEQLERDQEKIVNDLSQAVLNFVLRSTEGLIFFGISLVLYILFHMLPLTFTKDDPEVIEDGKFVNGQVDPS